MLPTGEMTLTWILAASSFAILLLLIARSRKDPVQERLEKLARMQEAGPGTRYSGGDQVLLRMPRGITAIENPINQWTTRRMRQQERKKDLHHRMMQAGLYSTGAVGFFYLLRLVLLVGPAVLGFLISSAGHISMSQGLLWGALAGIAGTLAPSFWLDNVKRARQTKIRRALPDALDVMVVCLEGGLSLSGTLSRVAHELTTAHPLLAVELQIVQRQIQMGHSTGDAIREFANRFDLEELRSMASVIIQSERMGSSVIGALEVFAETLRLKRQQQAEELAHKATVKMLFPTLFLIFPAVFIVLLGPAVIQIYEQLILGVLRNAGRS
jgi:tight adherence protein C